MRLRKWRPVVVFFKLQRRGRKWNSADEPQAEDGFDFAFPRVRPEDSRL
jgi:hypothetical protein